MSEDASNDSSDSSTYNAPSPCHEDGSNHEVVHRSTTNNDSHRAMMGDSDDPVQSDLCKSNKSNLRLQLGESLSNLSDFINSNLIIVRYATASTVFLLGVYGIANTPLFYRYTSVTDIPTSHFIRRKWIHGRIVEVLENRSPTSGVSAASVASTRRSNSANRNDSAGISSLLSTSLRGSVGNSPTQAPSQRTNETIKSEIRKAIQNPTPITILFRHSSFAERLLTQSAFEKITALTGKTFSTSSRLLYSSANPHRNLLAIELAGVVAPPLSFDGYCRDDGKPSSQSTASISNSEGLFRRLAEQKARVSLQLLAQRTYHANLSSHSSSRSKTTPRSIMGDDVAKYTAICHLHYRKPDQWFTTTNASLEAVEKGQACVSKEGMVLPPSCDGAGRDGYDRDEDDFESNRQSSNRSKNNTGATNYLPTIKQLQNDADFISRLEQAEYAAWKSKVGMWSSPELRTWRKEYVKEEEFSKKAISMGNIWGWVKKGWHWLRRG